MSNETYWQSGFVHLKEYVNTYGNANVSSTYVSPDGFQLGTWVVNRRMNYRKNNLDKEQVQKLLSIGFIFDGYVAWEAAKEQEWEDGYSHLLDFYKANGHSNVGLNYCAPDGFALGSWIQLQRIAYKQNRLTIEHYDRLISLGVERLSPPGEDVFQKKWDEGYRHLQRYYKKYGNTDVKTNYICPWDKYPLGNWIMLQRKNDKNNILAAEAREKLLALGFQFSVQKESYDRSWENGYKHLVEFLNHHKTLSYINDYVSPDGYKLGYWLQYQMKLIRKNKLSSERVQRLRNLGLFSGNTLLGRQTRWETGYMHLVAYYTKHKHSNVPISYECDDGFRLGNWVHQQRQSYKSKSLSVEQLTMLNKVNFIYDYAKAVWEEYFALLVQYKEQYGTACVSSRYDSGDGTNLYNWLSLQIKNYRAGRLSKKKTKRLLSLGVNFHTHEIVRSSDDIYWGNGYNHLTRYLIDHHGAFPKSTYKAPDGFPVGAWLKEQRDNYDRLSLNQICKLESVGFIWKGKAR